MRSLFFEKGPWFHQAVNLRIAELTDLPIIAELIPISVRGLSQQFYAEQQIESAIRFVFGPDTQLIRDRTYFVVENEKGLIGCGGWSKRRTLYGGDQMKGEVDPMLDPELEAARIRAFFVHPDFARRGVGSTIMQACFQAAASAGFKKLELVATLPGEPLYRNLGFQVIERIHPALADGTKIEFVRMGMPMPEQFS